MNHAQKDPVKQGTQRETAIMALLALSWVTANGSCERQLMSSTGKRRKKCKHERNRYRVGKVISLSPFTRQKIIQDVVAGLPAWWVRLTASIPLSTTTKIRHLEKESRRSRNDLIIHSTCEKQRKNKLWWTWCCSFWQVGGGLLT
ncbi:hypothetical protein IWX46DRAFT_617540, partial [Phyllosticta citricarpa]